jgi:NhaP-type Na+/H+ or K+/H+ antiporter
VVIKGYVLDIITAILLLLLIVSGGIIAGVAIIAGVGRAFQWFRTKWSPRR